MKTLKPIPGFSKYGITQCARLVNLKTKRELRTHSNGGYQQTVLVNDSGKIQAVRRHRLVALTHLPPPDNPEQTSVNHIDHIPGNDHVDNLEWCTTKENMQHAAAAGRMVGNSRIVVVRDLITNQITTYSQLQHVIPLLGYDPSTIRKWVNNRDQAVLPGLYQVQYLDELRPWRHVEDIFGELEMYTHRKVVVRFDADWSNPVVYESARICGYHNNIKKTTLTFRLKRKGQHIWSDKYRYAYYSDLSEEQRTTARHKVLHTKDTANDYRKLQREYLRRSGVISNIDDISDPTYHTAKFGKKE